MDYIPLSEKDDREMLERIGVADAAELFSVIPEKKRVAGLRLPEGMSEERLVRTFEGFAAKNLSLKETACFRGGGIYDHFVPAMVGEVLGRSEFFTAYTPYQPEASQGTLQAVFEYQSLIAELTGLDVSNASLYDGATAVAEAALLALRASGRNTVLVSSAVHPEYRRVLQTYLANSSGQIQAVPCENGATGAAAVKSLLSSDTAALIIQSPNFFGSIEDLAALREATRAAGALLVTVVNPLSLGVLKPPGDIGADIAVGEGQVLGNATGFGGATFGFMTCRKEFAWKMPGRIVGQTVDAAGRRGFVLTLQSREQHIRREKATSNICTNAALNALAGCVYLAGWGPDGIRNLGEVNVQKSHYAFEKIAAVAGFSPAFPDQPFFNEFAITTTKDIAAIQKKLRSKKILGPLELGKFYPEFKDHLLFCVTEKRTKEEIDLLVDVLSSVN